MALNFPANPSVGQVYNTGLKTWKWSGYSWTTLGVGEGTVIATSETPPLNPSIGDLWFNDNTAVLSVFYVDDNSEQWVTVSTSSNAEGGGANVVSQETAPTDPSAGDLWFNTNTAVLYIYYADSETLQWVTVTPSIASIGSGASVTTSETAPSTPEDGDLWFSTGDGNLYVYYVENGGSSQWVSTVATAADASAVSYTPAGTGAQVTTVQTKLRETVSVKDYGAVGDNATDDTAAINLAIADMNNGVFKTLYFPAGKYVISSPLTTITNNNLSFVADGIQACTLRYKSNAGTNGTFFVIGDATTRCSQLLIQGIQFTCSNSLTLDGVGNALIFNNSIQCAVRGCETSGVNGLAQVGSTALGTNTNSLTISHTGGVCEASAGGKCLDLQSWAGLKLDHCNFSASGVASSSFRGLYAHPQVGDLADVLKAINCEWNYPNNDPDVVIEYDFSQNTTGNQQFTNCVFDQAAGLGSRNIYAHIDSGKAVDAKGRLMFNNCISNASTDATCIEIDNTGDGRLSVDWVGGQLTYTGTDGRCAYITGGNNVNTRFSSVFFQSRAANQPDVAIEVDDGCSGVTVIGCSFGVGNYNSVHFDYPFRFNGQITDLILTGNNASGSVSGLLIDWVAQPTTLFETRVIKNNITPQQNMPYRLEVASATTSTGATISLEDESVYRITAKVLGRTKNATAFVCMYEVTGLFYRDGGGVVTLQGSLITPVSVEGAAGLDATLSVSTNDVILELSSPAGSTTVFDYDLEIDENLA